MGLEVNSHVERMGRFQPFSASSADAVHEQGDPGPRGFPTAAFQHVLATIESPQVRVVVLTGDAGHGKTHLCAKLLEELGIKSAEAHRLIVHEADGRHVLAHTKSERPIRMVKDLSEHGDMTAELLSEMLELDSDSVTVICANEGLLRQAVAMRPTELDVLTRTLEEGIKTGRCASVNPGIHVINLNYQSVAPEDGEGLVDWALNSWGADKRSWRACGKCDAHEGCPIFANHRMLSDQAGGVRRREKIRLLMATAERTGSVVTIRHALATIAHAITGGTNCRDVHRRHRQKDWQHRHLFHQALFGDRLTPHQRTTQVPTFMALRRLDPGHTALRGVDDLLEPDETAVPFLPTMPVVEGATPRSKRDAQRESETLHNMLVFLRRRDFFDSTDAPGPYERMGLRGGEQFEQAATDGAGCITPVAVRDTLLRGLEAIQGVRRTSNPADFLVLDPAFVNHRSRAAVVGHRIPSRNILVEGQVAHWRHVGDPQMHRAVDWLSRTAFVRMPNELTIPLDLFRFELLLRWADGLRARSEHAAAVRLINGLLAKAMPRTEGDEIVVLVGGERRTLSIDVGDRIRSGEA